MAGRRPKRRGATPVSSKPADPSADPSGGKPAPSAEDEVIVLPDPTPVVEAEAQVSMAPKVDPNENRPKPSAELAEKVAEKAARDEERAKQDAKDGAPNALLNTAEPAPDLTPAPAPTPADPKSLAPKVMEGDGGRRLPKYHIREMAVAAELARGVHQGSGLDALPPGEWRIMRTQAILMRGHVQELREGTIVNSLSMDVRHLKRCGVALQACNDRAFEIEQYGWDYDPRVAAADQG